MIKIECKDEYHFVPTTTPIKISSHGDKKFLKYGSEIIEVQKILGIYPVSDEEWIIKYSSELMAMISTLKN